MRTNEFLNDLVTIDGKSYGRGSLDEIRADFAGTEGRNPFEKNILSYEVYGDHTVFGFQVSLFQVEYEGDSEKIISFILHPTCPFSETAFFMASIGLGLPQRFSNGTITTLEFPVGTDKKIAIGYQNGHPADYCIVLLWINAFSEDPDDEYKEEFLANHHKYIDYDRENEYIYAMMYEYDQDDASIIASFCYLNFITTAQEESAPESFMKEHGRQLLEFYRFFMETFYTPEFMEKINERWNGLPRILQLGHDLETKGGIGDGKEPLPAGHTQESTGLS